MKIQFDTTECTRCNGEGRIDIYRHVAGGVCAKCTGSGRMLSRSGAAANRAYERELTVRLGRKALDLQVGDVIENFEGSRGDLVQAIEYRDSGVYVTHAKTNGTMTRGFAANRLIRLWDPSVTEAVAGQIAAKFPGASLI